MKYYGQELYHFGIPGQKWGQRRYQNPDGSLTEEGRIHYGYGESKERYRIAKQNLKNASSYQDKKNAKHELKTAKHDLKESKKGWGKTKKQIKNAIGEYNDTWKKRNSNKLSELKNTLDRKKELYKKDVENNRDLLEKSRDETVSEGWRDLASKAYEANVKRSKNAYEKAKNEFDTFTTKGNDYANRKAKETFGKDYDAFIEEINTRSAIASGMTIVAGIASIPVALYLMNK